MSKKIRTPLFDEIIDQYTLKPANKKKRYYKRTISELLVEDRTQHLLRNALGNPNKMDRIAAIVELGKLGSTKFEVDILKRLTINEPDLELRYYASEAINSIRNRLG